MSISSESEIVFSQYAQDPLDGFSEMFRSEPEHSKQVTKDKKPKQRCREKSKKQKPNKSFVMSRLQRRGIKLIKISVVDLCNNNSQTIDSDSDSLDPTTAMSVEGQRCLCVVVLLIHTVTGAGEGPSSSIPTSSSSSVKPDQNELTVTFPPLDDLYSNTPEKHFGTENNTVVTSQTGSTALLPCVIRNIGDGIDWTLKVRFVQKRDAGIYECQVSSHPPTSIFLRLDVVGIKVITVEKWESYASARIGLLDRNDDTVGRLDRSDKARAQISGPTEKYLKPGSTLRLQCSVVQTTEAPAFVFWYHNSRMINYDVERGINVTTDPVQRLSDLLIPAASVSHAGNYTCVPNNAVPASIYVHIFNGENPAAMQSSSPSFINRLHNILLPTLISYNLIR
ncbi:unnamed protein product [Spodoptera exigua]|nr:unnamed protein product [Spodoptera exigua]